jgi:hypothetical protein
MLLPSLNSAVSLLATMVPRRAAEDHVAPMPVVMMSAPPSSPVVLGTSQEVTGQRQRCRSSSACRGVPPVETTA